MDKNALLAMYFRKARNRGIKMYFPHEDLQEVIIEYSEVLEALENEDIAEVLEKMISNSKEFPSAIEIKEATELLTKDREAEELDKLREIRYQESRKKQLESPPEDIPRLKPYYNPCPQHIKEAHKKRMDELIQKMSMENRGY